MFTNISWTNYIIVIILLLAAWYIIIGLKFYFRDLQNILSGKSKLAFRGIYNKYSSPKNEEITNSEPLEVARNSFPNEEETNNLLQVAEELTSKLKEAISDASSKKYNKEEFIFLLQFILKEYLILKNSPFQIAINNLIASECNKNSFIRLSAVELAMLWNEVSDETSLPPSPSNPAERL